MIVQSPSFVCMPRVSLVSHSHISDEQSWAVGESSHCAHGDRCSVRHERAFEGCPQLIVISVSLQLHILIDSNHFNLTRIHHVFGYETNQRSSPRRTMMSQCILLLPLLQVLLGRLTASESTPVQQKKYSLTQSENLELLRQTIPVLENKTLIVGLVVREPFVIYDYQADASKRGSSYAPESDLDNYKGVAIEVIKRLADMFRFKIKIILPKDKQFGVQLQDGTWSGLLGSLLRNESDVGITALSITVSRVKVVDFTRAYYVETAAMLLPIPEEVQNYLAILQPFSLAVWLLLLATIIILILLITIMSWLEEEQRERSRKHKLAKSLARSIDRGIRNRAGPLEMLKYTKPVERFRAITWLERFYYATSCVLNILLIRGE